MEPFELADVSRLTADILDEVELAVVGKRTPLTIVLAAILAGGHVLLEDFPGLGKTLAARSFAQTLGLPFARANSPPTSSLQISRARSCTTSARGEFVFRRGPLFTGLLLADEINRTPPRTQSALLEAMQEHQITVEGETFVLEQPFHVIATANPVEYEGTYPLPEAQLDRFMLQDQLRVPDGRRRMGRTRNAGWHAGTRTRRCARSSTRRRCSPCRLRSNGSPSTRASADTASHSPPRPDRHPHSLMGASPRGAIGLLLTARAIAVIGGPRLRDTRGRQVRGDARARPPDHGATRDVDECDHRRDHRGGRPVHRADPIRPRVGAGTVTQR